ncbi:hypothetical protein VTJ83DRAFT_970 [Remersonia thermophila]|uniref:WW domain-containing protein n=1 Tax=Remersonia thermophila TaxID=72144 RepID=A0ABR4DMP5_9PEZI
MAGKKSAKGKQPMRNVTAPDRNDGNDPSTRHAISDPNNNNNNNDNNSPDGSNKKNTRGLESSAAALHASAAGGTQSTTSQPTLNNPTAAGHFQPGLLHHPCVPPQVIAANPYQFRLSSNGVLPFQSTHRIPGFAPLDMSGIPGAPGYMFNPAAAQPLCPNPPPPTNNPPDELYPPPPPPPAPPAAPPVLNVSGVHFQPQVPGTENGPMVHKYVPRQDPVHMVMPGQPVPAGYVMANGNVVPLQSLPVGVAPPAQPQPVTATVGVAPITAPATPVVIQTQQPPVVIQQQPGLQPIMLASQAVPGTAPQVAFHPGCAPAPAIPVTGNAPAFLAPGLPAQPPVHAEPALGVGLTQSETLADNIRMAQDNKAYEPQDFKPADPDPYRLYWFRELNGHWALFPRRQIDRLCARWYRTDDGVFYAVRLVD